jgi:uncharacterized protein
MAGKQPLRRKHVPQRTCVACRRQFDKRRLTRIVRTPDDGVVIDLTGKRNGRGAYICDQPECWDKIARQVGILNNALNTQVTDEERARIAAHGPAGQTVTIASLDDRNK